MDNVDKTIDALCDWIQENLKSETDVEKSVVAEMTKALAELVATKKELQAINKSLEPSNHSFTATYSNANDLVIKDSKDIKALCHST